MNELRLQEAVKLLERTLSVIDLDSDVVVDVEKFLASQPNDQLVAVSERHLSPGTTFIDVNDDVYIMVRSTTFNNHALNVVTGAIVSTHRIFQKDTQNGHQ